MLISDDCMSLPAAAAGAVWAKAEEINKVDSQDQRQKKVVETRPAPKRGVLQTAEHCSRGDTPNYINEKSQSCQPRRCNLRSLVSIRRRRLKPKLKQDDQAICRTPCGFLKSSIRPLHLTRAALRLRSLTWPYPLIWSGIRAISTAIERLELSN